MCCGKGFGSLILALSLPRCHVVAVASEINNNNKKKKKNENNKEIIIILIVMIRMMISTALLRIELLRIRDPRPEVLKLNSCHKNVVENGLW